MVKWTIYDIIEITIDTRVVESERDNGLTICDCFYIFLCCMEKMYTHDI